MANNLQEELRDLELLREDVETPIDPDDLLKYLRALQLALGSSRVEASIEGQPPEAKNDYSLLRADVRRMVARLTAARLRAVASELEQHNKELRTSAAELREEIQSLANIWNLVTSLDKFVGLIGQIAVSVL